MSLQDILISLRPSFGFNIWVAVVFALSSVLLIWQGSWTLITLTARPNASWSRALRASLAIIVFSIGSLGTALVAGLTAGVLYWILFAAVLLGMAFQSKREPRLPLAELDPDEIERQIRASYRPEEAKIFAAAVELQLQAADIEVGLFRNGISPLEKRAALGKKTIRTLR